MGRVKGACVNEVVQLANDPYLEQVQGQRRLGWKNEDIVAGHWYEGLTFVVKAGVDLDEARTHVMSLAKQLGALC